MPEQSVPTRIERGHKKPAIILKMLAHCEALFAAVRRLGPQMATDKVKHIFSYFFLYIHILAMKLFGT
jgi:hypothetical protein